MVSGGRRWVAITSEQTERTTRRQGVVERPDRGRDQHDVAAIAGGERPMDLSWRRAPSSTTPVPPPLLPT
jgi:hypothetical protein